MRLFVAIHPDTATQTWLAEAQARLRKALGRDAHGLRWVLPDQVHLTLVFLGELPDAASVVELLKPCRFAPMELAVGGVGVFPKERRPAVLWAGISEASGALARLQGELSAALSPLVEPDRRRFEPHLTLARVPRGSRWRGNLEKLSAAVGAAPQPWKVTHFALMQSHPERGVVRYETLHRFRCNLAPQG